MKGSDRFSELSRSASSESRNGPSVPVIREGIELFLAALGLFLAALVWFWISLSRG